MKNLSHSASTMVLAKLQTKKKDPFVAHYKAYLTDLPDIVAEQDATDSANANQSSEVWTEPEVAGYLKLQIYTLRKWRREGGGPPYIRCGGRLIRYVRNDIVDWLANNKFGSNAHELSAKIAE